jgi:hypothetical protein
LVEVVLEGCWWSWGRVLARRLPAEAFDGDGDGHVLQVGLGLPVVAAHAVAVAELSDGALDAGTYREALVPGRFLPFEAVA